MNENGRIVFGIRNQRAIAYKGIISSYKYHIIVFQELENHRGREQ